MLAISQETPVELRLLETDPFHNRSVVPPWMEDEVFHFWSLEGRSALFFGRRG